MNIFLNQTLCLSNHCNFTQLAQVIERDNIIKCYFNNNLKKKMNLLVEYDMVLHFNHFEIQLDDLQNYVYMSVSGLFK